MTWRVLLPMVVAAPVIGILGAQVAAGAGGPVGRRANPPMSVPRPAVAHQSISTRNGASDTASVPAARGVALEPAPRGRAAVITNPTTEAQVAQDVIAAVDVQSKGAYSIAATPTNLLLLESWMNNEGGLWADNPLNTSLDAGRYAHQITTSGQNTGIPIFPTIQIGVDATAATLLTNHAYADILRVLAPGDANCATFARAVIDSPWAASHYGHDPARFCGASSATGTVPAVTACLRLPGGGNRFGARATRVPGSCGRFAAHNGLSRAPRRAAGSHPAGSHPAGSHAAGHRGTAHRTASHHAATRQGPGPTHQAVRRTGAARRARR